MKLLNMQFSHSPVTISPLGTIVPQKLIVLFLKVNIPLFSNNYLITTNH